MTVYKSIAISVVLFCTLSLLSCCEERYPYRSYEEVKVVKKIHLKREKLQVNDDAIVESGEWSSVFEQIDLRKDGRVTIISQYGKSHVFEIDTFARNAAVELTKAVDDSKNYPGGECGTISTDWQILFVKNEVDIVGRIEVSFDCMDVYFDPPIKIEFPYLSENGRRVVLEALEKFGSKRCLREVYRNKP